MGCLAVRTLPSLHMWPECSGCPDNFGTAAQTAQETGQTAQAFLRHQNNSNYLPPFRDPSVGEAEILGSWAAVNPGGQLGQLGSDLGQPPTLGGQLGQRFWAVG